MKIAKPRAILFDWDNTLVNTWPVIHRALQETFIAMEHEPWTLKQTKARVRKSMRDSFPEIFGDKWERASDIYQTSYRTLHLAELEALPEAEAVLKHLKERGDIYLAIVSNKKGHNLRKELAHIGWDRFFSKIVGADDAARDKPHPDPVVMALAGSGIEPGSDVWFVGDSDVDLECAKNTGCVPVLYGPIELEDGQVLEGNYNGFRYEHYAPDHPSFMELLQRIG